jgi:ABC-type molybdate transport system ATPase subunit
MANIKHIDELIQRLNISHLINQFPPTLSGGEAQRVALARLECVTKIIGIHHSS